MKVLPLHPGPSARGDEFRAMPRSAQILVGGTIAAGFASLVWVSHLLRWDRPGLFVELLALAVLTSTVKVSLPLSRSGSTMSLSVAISFAALLILGTAEAVVITLFSAWAQCTFRVRVSNPVHRTLFSMASVGLSVHVAGEVFSLVRGEHTDFFLGVARPLGPATITYFAANTLLVAGAIATSTKQRLARVWMGSFFWSAPSYFIAAAAAALAESFAREGSLAWAALVAVPLYMTYRSYRAFIARLEEERSQVRRMSDVQLATIEALALAIEVKDRTPRVQVRRMQVYSEGLARAAALSEDEIHAVKTAAMLHDIGHLAVPEHILGKPGPLTAEEYDRVKIHPKVGAEILASVPFPTPVTPLIAAHHERWDGSGYPDGLTGDVIPLGARVLAVADTFTSLLFDRPYRKAHSYSEALAIVRASAGASLDPSLVKLFIELLPEFEVRIQVEGDAAAREARATYSALGPNALENIAVAHHEAKVLYEIAQALGTSLGVEETVTLIEGKLRGLLPFSCCALFLYDGRSQYTARVAFGAGAREVLGLRGASLEWLAQALPRPAANEPPLCSVLLAPLEVGAHTVGALALYDYGAGTYDADQRRVLDLVARHAAPVIQNAIVFEETQEASLTDPLTGLANRRALQQHLQKELARAHRQNAPLTVLLLDMDGLKEINDTYGHHMGDRALREVASVLRQLLRPYDLCARYAGDEFVIVLWECDAAQAESRRLELQAAVSEASIDVGRGKWASLAVSAGAATYGGDGTTADTLLAAADERMYRDKVARKRKGAVVVCIHEGARASRVAAG
jgi:diguanylate cyclase (GGDEF)-like protein